MTATATQRREVYILCGAVRLRAVRTVDYAVLARLGDHYTRWEEQIKIYYVRSCSAQRCSDSFI